MPLRSKCDKASTFNDGLDSTKSEILPDKKNISVIDNTTAVIIISPLSTRPIAVNMESDENIKSISTIAKLLLQMCLPSALL
jgi:hypothetical protein